MEFLIKVCVNEWKNYNLYVRIKKLKTPTFPYNSHCHSIHDALRAVQLSISRISESKVVQTPKGPLTEGVYAVSCKYKRNIFFRGERENER